MLSIFNLLVVILVFISSNAETCVDENEDICAHIIQKYPLSCSSSIGFIDARLFNDYCSKTCNKICSIFADIIVQMNNPATLTKLATSNKI